jgi:hypothetical protein
VLPPIIKDMDNPTPTEEEWEFAFDENPPDPIVVVWETPGEVAR